jgi:hypothetical protein
MTENDIEKAINDLLNKKQKKNLWKDRFNVSAIMNEYVERRECRVEMYFVQPEMSKVEQVELLKVAGFSEKEMTEKLFSTVIETFSRGEAEIVKHVLEKENRNAVVFIEPAEIPDTNSTGTYYLLAQENGSEWQKVLFFRFVEMNYKKIYGLFKIPEEFSKARKEESLLVEKITEKLAGFTVEELRKVVEYIEGIY